MEWKQRISLLLNKIQIFIKCFNKLMGNKTKGLKKD